MRVDQAGCAGECVTPGLTDEEHQGPAEWAEGPMLFEHVRDLRAPVGIPDVPAYLHSLGFSSDRLPSRSFQGTPVRHRGGHAGHFYLVEKEGAGGFTVEDVRKAGGNGLAARSPRPGVIGAGYGSGSPQFTMRTPCPPRVDRRPDQAHLPRRLLARGRRPT